MAGRDIGTIVLPDADLKLFLDASVEERARRRILERGIDPASDEGAEIVAELKRRDELDSTRAIAPLRAATDAVVIRTDGNAIEDTIRQVVEAIRAAEAARDAATRCERRRASPMAPRRRHSPRRRQPSIAEPRRLRRPERAARAPRRPIEPTPIATKSTVPIRFGSMVLRSIARAIVRFRVEGDLAAIPKSGPMIMAANHASSADPVLIGAFLNQVLGRPLNWLGKRELIEFPLTGWAFRIAGIHPVDREAADLEAFRTAMRILEAGQTLAVFPEGTRSQDGGAPAGPRGRRHARAPQRRAGAPGGRHRQRHPVAARAAPAALRQAGDGPLRHAVRGRRRARRRPGRRPRAGRPPRPPRA